MATRLQRGWINQPSTLQPLHHRHGTRVLIDLHDDGFATVYFISGPVVSARVPNSALSLGWPNQEEN